MTATLTGTLQIRSCIIHGGPWCVDVRATWCNLVTISCAGQNIRDRLSRSPAGRVTFGIIETFLRFICRSVKPFARFWPTFAELSFFLSFYQDIFSSSTKLKSCAVVRGIERRNVCIGVLLFYLKRRSI